MEDLHIKILKTYDLSATPFRPSGKGKQSEKLFAWIVSDFGLNDSIESGLVKTPRVAVRDDSTIGDDLKSKHQFETSPSLQNRFGMLQYKLSANMSGVTNTHTRDYAIIKEECSNLSLKLKLMIAELNAIHSSLKSLKDFPYIKD